MSFGSSAMQVLKTVAPMLATATLGPFAPFANTLIAKALGTDPKDAKATEAAILSASPEVLAALQKAHMEFLVHMKELNISEEKLSFDDTANARAMQMANKDTTPRNLSYMLLIFTGAVIAAVLMGLAKVDGALVGSLVGYLVSENKAVMNFWFGRSAGSAAKDQTITDLATAP